MTNPSSPTPTPGPASAAAAPPSAAIYTTLIDVPALAARIVDAASSLCIVDCRADLMDPAAGARAFAERHLPGARFLALDDDLSGPKTGGNGRHPLPDQATLVATLGRMGIGADTQVVAYDALDGRYAARLWWLLRWLGHERVAVLDGGFAAWEAGGGLVEFSPPRPAHPVDFPVRPSLTRIVSVEEVMRNLTSGQQRVVDARAADRFRGENETIDPVGGHIPGAVNRFFANNVSADGRFKDPAQLRADFTAVLNETPVTESIMQCGSGVTACHNLLALEIAGLSGAALYPGSWSEWVADRTRPVATGD